VLSYLTVLIVMKLGNARRFKGRFQANLGYPIAPYCHKGTDWCILFVLWDVLLDTNIWNRCSSAFFNQLCRLYENYLAHRQTDKYVTIIIDCHMSVCLFVCLSVCLSVR